VIDLGFLGKSLAALTLSKENRKGKRSGAATTAAILERQVQDFEDQSK
jgi:hypothetical protein